MSRGQSKMDSSAVSCDNDTTTQRHSSPPAQDARASLTMNTSLSSTPVNLHPRRRDFDVVPSLLEKKSAVADGAGSISADVAVNFQNVESDNCETGHQASRGTVMHPFEALHPEVSSVIVAKCMPSASTPLPTVVRERDHTNRCRHDSSPAASQPAAEALDGAGVTSEEVVSAGRSADAGSGYLKEDDVCNSSGNCTQSTSTSLGRPGALSVSEKATGRSTSSATAPDRPVPTVISLAREPLRELVVGCSSGGGGSGGVGRQENIVVDKARLATVQCYLRDDDPIFIRRNLNRLRKGTLAQLAVGDFVKVARRCRGGENNEGGAGSVTRVLPDFFYGVKYVVGGTERRVDGCFLKKTELGARKRRGATPRCPDCKSFLHDCACDEYLDVAATAAAEDPSSTSVSSNPPSHGPLNYKEARPLKRPRCAMDSGAKIQQHSSMNGDACVGAPKDSAIGGAGQAMEEESHGHAKMHEDVQQDMDVEKNGSIGSQSGRGDSGANGVGADIPFQALNDQHLGVDTSSEPASLGDSRQCGTTEIFSGDLQRRPRGRLDGVDTGNETTFEEYLSGWGHDEGGCERDYPSEFSDDDVESKRRHESRRYNGGFTHEPSYHEQESSGDAEVLCMESAEAVVDPTTKDNDSDRGATRGTGFERENAQEGGGGSQPDRGEDRASTQWRPRKGDLVEVERRMTPGVNKPGGTARVVKVDSSTCAVDVRYVVERGWERGIDPVYVRPAVLDMSHRRPTLGRCPYCGSLRVDCGQRCEFYLESSSRRLLPPMISSRVCRNSVLGEGPVDGAGTDQDGRGREGRRHGRRWRREDYQSRVSDLATRDEGRLQRRRHLPQDWDEEGDPVPRSDVRGKGEGGSESDLSSTGCRDWLMENDSDGTLGRKVRSDLSSSNAIDGIATKSQRRRRCGDARVDTESSTDDEIEAFAFVRDRWNSHSGRRRVFSNSSSNSSGDSDSSRSGGDSNNRHSGASDATGISSTEECSGGEDLSSSSERGVGGQGWRGDLVDAGNGKAARFLMPEGEEAARMLPSDIADPTRGVKDPARLRRELKIMLHEMEDRAANELEQAVPAACRRVTPSSRAPAEIDLSLEADLRALAARTTRTLRRLDVANNVFVRLEKLDARWREGNEGVNAWHRLSGLTDRLEQLRRDVNKALREHAYASPCVSAVSDSSSDGADAADASGSGSCSGDLDPPPKALRRETLVRRVSEAPFRRGRANVRRKMATPGEEGASARNWKRSGGDGGGGTGSKDASASVRGERRRRDSVLHARCSGVRDHGWGGRGTGRDGEAEEREAPYLLGLDYGMAVESDEAGASGRGYRDSEYSSPSASSSLSSSPSQSPRSPSGAAATGSRRGKSRRQGVSGCGDWAHGEPRGSRERSRSARGRIRRSRVAVEHRGSSSASTGVLRGGASGRRGSTLRSVSAPADERGRRARSRVQSVAARRTRPRTEINGRALMEQQYFYRLAQQRARGAPHPLEEDAPGTVTSIESVPPLYERDKALARSTVELQGRPRKRGAAAGGVPEKSPKLPSLVEDLMSLPPKACRLLRFKTLYSQNLDVNSATVDGLTLQVDGVDSCLVIPRGLGQGSRSAPDTMAIVGGKDYPIQSQNDLSHEAYGDEHEVGLESRGELVRAINKLPQRMADLEELATVEGLEDGEVLSLARECCGFMAVIGAKLRALCSPPLDHVNGPKARQEPSREILRAVRVVLERLVEACAPGRDTGGGGGRTPGLSLTRVTEIGESLADSADSAVLVETCAAFHVHLLEWLALSHESVDGDGVLASSAEPERNDPGMRRTLGGPVMDFARRLLLDLLLLFEKRLPARPVDASSTLPKRDDGTLGPSLFPTPAPLHVSKDPLAELLSALMETLDGTAGDRSSLPGPAASVNTAGLARPLVGFWGVFFEIISGGPSVSVGDDGGGGGGGGSSWNVSLPSELVWKALMHAFHLSAFCRRWDGDETSGTEGIVGSAGAGAGSGAADGSSGRGGSGRGSATVATGTPEALVSSSSSSAAAAARRKLRAGETSTALWECVRLLLAASPFYMEFRARGQAFAVTATANATAVQAENARRVGAVVGEVDPRSSTSGAASTLSGLIQPIVPAAEAFSAPGMVARALLERVLVLARFRAPETGPRGVVETLWGGVERISRAMCVERFSSTETPNDSVADAAVGTGARVGVAEHGNGIHDERFLEEGRIRRRRLRCTRKSLVADAEDSGRLLSAVVDAWALPVHRFCRLPAVALDGVSGARGDDRGGKARAEGDYDALCALLSMMTQEHATRVPEGLKRRKLANGLLKVKNSSVSGAPGLCLDDDEDHALATPRVLLGVALGLARAGLVANGAKEVAKAAAVRPRNVTAGTPRDRSIFLIAPAAAALCLALPRPGRGENAGVAGGGGSAVRATLFEVLAGCMRDAVDLMVMVLDGAGRLGHAVNPERLDRPRAAVGLAASCILLALRHLVPSSLPPPRGLPSSGSAIGRQGDPGAVIAQGAAGSKLESAALNASVATGAFAETLGRALQTRVVDRLGSPVVNAVMAALLQCWLPALSYDVDAPRHPRSSPGTELTLARARKEALSAIIDEGFAMGWSKDYDPKRGSRGYGGRVHETVDPPASGETIASNESTSDSYHCDGVVGRFGDGSGADGVVAGREAQSWDGGGDEMRDEYGSWDGLCDDAELDALLTGGSSVHSVTQTQATEVEDAERERRRLEAAKAIADAQAPSAAAVAAAARDKEEEERAWRSLAEGARLHVLPYMFEIIKKAFTVARFADGSTSAARLGAGALVAPRSKDAEAGMYPFPAVGAGVSPREGSCVELDASVALGLHASAALVTLRGTNDGTARGGRGSGDRCQGKKNHDNSSFYVVRSKYLEVHRMAHNPIVPQQRLLSPAFFCVALDIAQYDEHVDCGDGDGSGGDVRENEIYVGPSNAPHCGVLFSRPNPIVSEIIKGREWELLQLWIQAAFDPLVFPASRRRGDRSRGRGNRFGSRGRGALGASEPSEIVRERFQGFTLALRVAFGSGAAGGRRRDEPEGQDMSPLDADVSGVFEKRLTCFEAAKLQELTLDEARVLARVLDAQSVIAHCGGLWAAAVTIAGPAALPEATRKRIKDRVVKLAHGCIKCLRRFLSEVFPRGQETDGRGNRGYDSAFRRLYGHAAYALTAFLMRMCGGALKGLPLRELVETCFEGLACRPSVASGSGSTGGFSALAGRAPNTELTALAKMHLPDLLQCFSEMPMTVAPVVDWIKNINDHAINGDAPKHQQGLAPASAADVSSPLSSSLLASLASGLRGELRYPSRSAGSPPHLYRRAATTETTVDIFVDVAAAAALTPPPPSSRSDPNALAKRMTRMRLEVLGDRKLRVARFLMEAATARRNGGGAREGQDGMRKVLVGKTRRLLVLLVGIFCRREPFAPDRTTSGAGGPGLTGTMPSGTPIMTTGIVLPPSRLPPVPPLSVLEDILPLMRPVYSLLGEALLGEPSPARQLGRQVVAAAAALSVAGLDVALSQNALTASRNVQSKEGSGLATAAGRVAECFADAVVLAVCTKLDTFLVAMSPGCRGDGTGDTGNNCGNLEETGAGRGMAALVDLGPRESQLETLLRDLGGWDAHGDAPGWPHHALPIVDLMASTENRAGEKGGDIETPLSALLEEAEAMATELTPSGVRWDGGDEAVVSRRVKSALIPRIKACRVLLAEG